jgi:hypothetical protein
MVAHEDVRMDGHFVRFGRLFEHAEVGSSVLVIDKDRLSVVASLKQVVRISGHYQSSLACHALSVNSL